MKLPTTDQDTGPSRAASSTQDGISHHLSTGDAGVEPGLFCMPTMCSAMELCLFIVGSLQAGRIYRDHGLVCPVLGETQLNLLDEQCGAKSCAFISSASLASFPQMKVDSR